MEKDSTCKPVSSSCSWIGRQNIVFVITLELHFHCAWPIGITNKEIILKEVFCVFVCPWDDCGKTDLPFS